jgi:hypothetical protein
MSLVLLLACASPEPSSGDLVWGEDWELDLDASDPLASHRPEGASCEERAISYEYDGVEIATADCGYAQLVQPLRVDIVAGQRARIVAWHQDLVAEEDAQAHLAVLIGSTVIWEQDVDIPSVAEIWDEELELPLDAAAGERVTLHLHNHGSNTWTLQSLSLVP